MTGQLPLPLAAHDEAPRPTGEPIRFVRRRGTRRYILRVMDDGSLSVTVPWWGNKREARAFVAAQHDWIAKQRARRADVTASRWTLGRPVLLDGVAHPLESTTGGTVRLGPLVVSEPAADAGRLQRDVERALRTLARDALPRELLALAEAHAIAVSRVSIRNQSSRWGSCSRDGAISLNWRLVQVPPFVREYVLLHELMHRRVMNHSARFWRQVAAVCPRYVEARRWLRVDGATLFHA